LVWRSNQKISAITGGVAETKQPTYVKLEWHTIERQKPQSEKKPDKNMIYGVSHTYIPVTEDPQNCQTLLAK